VPVGDIHAYCAPILADEAAGKPPQETGGRSQGQEGQRQQRRREQGREPALRAERPGKEAVGRSVIEQRQIVLRRSVEEPGRVGQGWQAAPRPAEADGEAEGIVPQAEAPGAGKARIRSAGAQAQRHGRLPAKGAAGQAHVVV